jgi:catechol 2,3-dioxygenase-like lactoylglutathione lyase family enzyme
MAAALRCEIFPADLDATVAFYVSVLGFELVRDETSRRHTSRWRGTRCWWAPPTGQRFPTAASGAP